MQAIGLDAGTIVNVIRAGAAPLEIAPEEVDQLRIAGVPQPVLDEIYLRVQCAASGRRCGPRAHRSRRDRWPEPAGRP